MSLIFREKCTKSLPDMHHSLLTGLLITLAGISKRVKGLQVVQLRHGGFSKWKLDLKTTIKQSSVGSNFNRMTSKCGNVSFGFRQATRMCFSFLHILFHYI